MPTELSIADSIEVGEVAVYKSANGTEADAAFGGSLGKPVPPVQIAYTTDALRWGYEGGAQTAASLRTVANYLIWLCGAYQLQAQNIIYGPGGGSVSPTPPSGTTPNGYDFVVDVTAGPTNPVKEGDTSVTLTSLIGFNIIFNRNNIPQSTINVGGSYYSWNKSLGIFSFSPAAVATELFQIIPV